MFSGSNRKLFRKPGLARQAVGILASSGDLANTVQQQTVPGFANGGDVNVDLYRGFSGQGVTGGSRRMPDLGYADAPQSQKYMMRDLISPGLEMPGGNTLTQKLYALAQDAYRRGDKQLGDNYMNQIIAAREVGAERGIDVDPKPTSQLLYEAYETGAQDVMGIGERKAAERMANLEAGREEYTLSPGQAGFDSRFMEPRQVPQLEQDIAGGISSLQNQGRTLADTLRGKYNEVDAYTQERVIDPLTANVINPAVEAFDKATRLSPNQAGFSGSGMEQPQLQAQSLNPFYRADKPEDVQGADPFDQADKLEDAYRRSEEGRLEAAQKKSGDAPSEAGSTTAKAAAESKDKKGETAADARAKLMERLLSGEGIAGGVPKKDRDIAAKGIADQLDMSIKEAKELTKEDSFWRAITAFGLGLASGEGEGFMRDAAKAAMGAFDFYNKDRKAEEELTYTRAVDRLKLNMQEEELALTRQKVQAEERQGDILAQAKLLDALYPSDKSAASERLIARMREILSNPEASEVDKQELDAILTVLGYKEVGDREDFVSSVGNVGYTEK